MENIKELRKKFNLTQEELAQKLGIPRPSISQIESGQREITSSELVNISQIFEISMEELMNPYAAEKKIARLERKGKLPHFNKEIFKQVLLYILEKCDTRTNLGKTVLYKLLYPCDFNYYKLYEESLTVAAYRKIAYGPAPCEFENIIEEMKVVFSSNFYSLSDLKQSTISSTCTASFLLSLFLSSHSRLVKIEVVFVSQNSAFHIGMLFFSR